VTGSFESLMSTRADAREELAWTQGDDATTALSFDS
jgi:hypothetical protein